MPTSILRDSYYPQQTGTKYTSLMLKQHGLTAKFEKAIVSMKTRRTSGSPNPPRITTEVKRAINLKGRNYNRVKQIVTPEPSEQYHRSLRICRAPFRRNKLEHEKRITLEAETNPERLFTYVRAKNKKEE